MIEFVAQIVINVAVETTVNLILLPCTLLT